MEDTLKKYPTKILKKEIDEHEIRIKELDNTKSAFDDHIKKHEDVYNKMIYRHDYTLYGEHSDDGLVTEMIDVKYMLKTINNTMKELKGYMKWAILIIVGGFLTAVINLVMK
ncbi:MAG: hypothetical protein AAGU75_16430 [Bacillota bacterium]|jgi:hypothetical protein